MKLIRLIPIVLFVSISTLGISQKVKLKYALTTGDSYQWAMDIDQKIDMTVQGQPMAMTQKLQFFMGFKIAEVYKDSFRVEQTIERIKMNQKVMGMDMVYDSDNPDMNNPMAAQMHQMFESFIGDSIIIVLDNYGNKLRTDFGGLETNQEFIRNVGSSNQFIVFPQKTLKVGDSWEDEVEPLVETGIMTNVKYTLTNVESGLATIKFEGKVTTDKEKSAGMEMKGEQSGELTIDTKTGWLNTSKVSQDMDMVINQNGMSIPAKVSGDVSVTTIR